MAVAQRVLGIDPGLTRCGIAVVDGPAASPGMVLATCVRTPPSQPLEQRLRAVHEAVSELIREHGPTTVAVERVLFSKNVRTAMVTGQVVGVALLAAAQAGLPVVQYPPTDVKLAVAGHGGADKDAVGRMVRLQLGLSCVPEPADVADALAVALTHLLRARHPRGPAGTPAGGGSSWEAALAANPNVRIVGGTA
ncbi:MAG TPA: crossover junction endodeoxyribonuclease RuvC [Nitriliruptorales bacterium]